MDDERLESEESLISKHELLFFSEQSVVHKKLVIPVQNRVCAAVVTAETNMSHIKRYTLNERNCLM